MIQVNAMGDACPIPVVRTKKAIAQLNGAGVVEVLVDNEIAVQNLTKMANQKGYEVKSEKLAEQEYKVRLVIGNGEAGEAVLTEPKDAESCIPDARENTVIAVSSSRMGEGNDELGTVLMKAYIYALTQLDTLPKTIIFYNGGASLTCEESPLLEDLKSLEVQGVEIMTCGTCLSYYNLSDKLKVGEVSNMYAIAEKLSQADRVIKP